jgi:hypothetical protein
MVRPGTISCRTGSAIRCMTRAPPTIRLGNVTPLGVMRPPPVAPVAVAGPAPTAVVGPDVAAWAAPRRPASTAAPPSAAPMSWRRFTVNAHLRHDHLRS